MSELKFFEEYFENAQRETCFFSEISEISELQHKLFCEYGGDYLQFYVYLTDNTGFTYKQIISQQYLGVNYSNFDCKSMEEVQEKINAISTVLSLSFPFLRENTFEDLKAHLKYYQDRSSDAFSYDPTYSKFFDSAEYRDLYKIANNMVSEIVQHTEEYWKKHK